MDLSLFRLFWVIANLFVAYLPSLRPATTPDSQAFLFFWERSYLTFLAVDSVAMILGFCIDWYVEGSPLERRRRRLERKESTRRERSLLEQDLVMDLKELERCHQDRMDETLADLVKRSRRYNRSSTFF